MKITGTCSRYQYQRMLVGKLFVNGVEVTPGGGSSSVSWTDITGKPPTFPPTIGTTATTALAGNTQLLALGTTAATAAAGNHSHEAATTTKLGFLKMAAAQDNSTATDVAGIVADFNRVLSKLKAAGLMAAA
ncbi:head fiber protein [Brucella pituitosa]|uniref:head fiber protein n=1 Tax=Brucella pituitosa TaxID=571256 RepID=UPI00192D1428|nr:head fiber protein [Brucella pituitosa]